MAELTLGFDQTLFDDVRSDVADIITDEVESLETLVVRESPVGVSSPSLFASWRSEPATIRANTIEASLENPLPDASFREAGRGPGRQPPIDPKLRAWALSKGISPYAVARKIAREGTERWKQGEPGNTLRIDPRDQDEPPTDRGPQKEATDRMLRRIAGLEF